MTQNIDFNLRNKPILERVVLNEAQKASVSCDRWPQLVFAGAGSGKTRVLTAKIAYLIEESGVHPNNIFAATFTNKAAREMLDRVEELTGFSCAGLWIGTFHALCARILRREARRIGYSQSFTIYDTADQLSVIKAIMKELGLDERTMQPRRLLHTISHFKNACLPPDQVQITSNKYLQRVVSQAYESYQKELRRQQAMDFDDLIANVVYLFRGQPEALAMYRTMFTHLLVDEYQDTNVAQFELLRLLGGEHRRIFAVGDDDQSIYGWRGARIENILSFEQSFPGATVFKLEQNYRSAQSILEFANDVIEGNRARAAKKLWSSRSGGEVVRLNRYRDDRHESDTITNRIQELTRAGVSLGDIAVLFRTNAQSRSFEEACRRKKIPYELVGGMSFYERKEIKDALAYVKLLVNPSDDVSFERICNVPPRGIGAKSRQAISAVARSRGRSLLETVMADEQVGVSGKAGAGLDDLRALFALLNDLHGAKAAPHEIMTEALRSTGYFDMLEQDDSEESRGRLENINELLNAMAMWEEDNPGGGIEEFLQETTLASDIDTWKHSGDAVSLMTFHAAKGLEFKAVFLVGLEDGLLPSQRNFDDEQKIEEERRLLYVGATRAMELLECSHVDMRWRFGTVMPMQPSRFLSVVTPGRFHYADQTASFDFAAPAPKRTSAARPGARRPQSPAPQPRQSSESASRPRPAPKPEDYSQEEVQYRTGQHVVHKSLGPGKILNISGFGPDMRLTILFNDGTRKRVMARFANLEVQ
jgi:DNA helicase-2/ATP-dependent DNA helicase PcrA